MRLRNAIAAMLLSSGLLIPAAQADEISDALAKAAEAYQNGDIGATMAALQEAETALQQRRAETLKTFLPAAMEGWTLQDNDTMAMAGEMLGGGYGVSRLYTKADGNSVSLDVIADSPMLAMVMGMFANPQMMQMSGMKTETIAGQTAMVDEMGGYQLMVANRFMITVGGSAALEEKRAYVERIDFEGLSKTP